MVEVVDGGDAVGHVGGAAWCCSGGVGVGEQKDPHWVSVALLGVVVGECWGVLRGVVGGGCGWLVCLWVLLVLFVVGLLVHMLELGEAGRLF